MDRRSFLAAGLGSLLLAACPRGSASAPRDGYMPPTVAADDGDDLPPMPATCVAVATADNIEGPFYKRGAPSRSVLVSANDDGERLVISGSVSSTSCEPLAKATIDVWQANAKGDYDLDGFRFRGRMAADAKGRWQVSTIVPGRYLNGRRYRPAHIHVKVSAPGFDTLTTQLYFDGDPYNEGDPFIDPSLVMKTSVEKKVRRAMFDFVLAA
jgi:protocatechuate 3,4-dioxygenase beta subunit